MKAVFRKIRRGLDRVLRPPTELNDDFLTWLLFINPGMSDRATAFCIDSAMRELPPDGAIVEIGAFAGLSTNMLTYLAARHSRANPLFSVDEWRFEGAHEGPLARGTTIRHEDYRRFVRESYMRNVEYFSGDRLPHAVEASADAFFDMWKREVAVTDLFGNPCELGGPISFAFIDGNHTYEYAARDFANCDRFLTRRGFVYLDDSSPHSDFEVRHLAREIARSSRYEVVMKNPDYLFRKL